jgi:hypothetical protein
MLYFNTVLPLSPFYLTIVSEQVVTGIEPRATEAHLNIKKNSGGYGGRGEVGSI